MNILLEVDAARKGYLTRDETLRAACLQFGLLPPESFVDLAFTKLGKDPKTGRLSKNEYDDLIRLFGILPHQKAFPCSKSQSDFEEFSRNMSLQSSSL